MKEGHQRPSGGPEVKILSEQEIQDRLYGGYLGRRRSGPTASRILPTRTMGPRPGDPEVPWTGSGILTGELERIRAELIALREQKEQLATALEQLSPSSQSVRASEVRPAPKVHRAAPRPTAGWLGKLAAIAALLGAGGYLAGGRLLQASPARGDPTPFTVQVAVYDTLVPAQLAVQFLEGMSYEAYLVQVPRKDGSVRYRICMGRYVTRNEAGLERLRLVGDPRFGYFKDAFVRAR